MSAGPYCPWCGNNACSPPGLPGCPGPPSLVTIRVPVLTDGGEQTWPFTVPYVASLSVTVLLGTLPRLPGLRLRRTDGLATPYYDGRGTTGDATDDPREIADHAVSKWCWVETTTGWNLSVAVPGPSDVGDVWINRASLLRDPRGLGWYLTCPELDIDHWRLYPRDGTDLAVLDAGHDALMYVLRQHDEMRQVLSRPSALPERL